MLQILTVFALAGTPTPLDPTVLPTFPERFVGRVHEECAVEMVSDAEGRLDVLAIEGCEENFAKAVRERLPWMTWQTPPTGGELVESTYALLTGHAGVPRGLYVRMVVRFERRGEAEPVVTIVPVEVIAPKKDGPLTLSTDLAGELGAECRLLVHVGEDGRTERVQAQTCSERVRAAVELPLMAWTWQPLVVQGKARAFAATLRLTPERLMTSGSD